MYKKSAGLLPNFLGMRFFIIRSKIIGYKINKLIFWLKCNQPSKPFLLFIPKTLFHSVCIRQCIRNLSVIACCFPCSYNERIFNITSMDYIIFLLDSSVSKICLLSFQNFNANYFFYALENEYVHFIYVFINENIFFGINYSFIEKKLVT